MRLRSGRFRRTGNGSFGQGDPEWIRTARVGGERFGLGFPAQRGATPSAAAKALTPQCLPCKSLIFISRSPTFCSCTWSVIQKLPVNEGREVMQQTNGSARRQLAMGQLNSIRAELRKSTGQP